MLMILPTSMPRLTIVGPSVLKLSIGQVFCVKGHCDLDLSPDEYNINTGHLLVINTLPAMFEVCKY